MLLNSVSRPFAPGALEYNERKSSLVRVRTFDRACQSPDGNST